MNLSFVAELADAYSSSLQKIRVLSEHWVSNQVYCPNCGHLDIDRYGNNSRVADFFCSACSEQYELKSQRKRFGVKVVDGAYRTMIERLSGSSNPNLFLLNYDLRELVVTNLLIIPKHFFTSEVIEKRVPLQPTARRAGWIGCRILLQGIPHAGRIFLIRDGIVEPKTEVLEKWRRTLFLREQKNADARGWLLQVMRCVERLGKSTFSLEEMYAYEGDLRGVYPGNRHIKAKIRQKLQVLRDKGYLEFVGRGIYKVAGASG